MEIFRNIPSYEGYYQVSNLGRVKSLERRSLIGRLLREKILNPTKSSDGYLSVNLYKNGNRDRKRIHQLVGEAFFNVKST